MPRVKAGHLGLVVALLLLASCAGGPQPTVQQWALEYPPPRPDEKIVSLPVALSVGRLAASPPYSSTAMVYRPQRFQRDTYTYHRWLVPPAEMVGDLLARDLRASGRFRAVFSGREGATARFLLMGGVERFLEVDTARGAQAELVLNLSLLDRRAKHLPRRLMFQRQYRAVAPMPARRARALAQALSQALARVSRQVLRDVYQAVARRLAQDEVQRKNPSPGGRR